MPTLASYELFGSTSNYRVVATDRLKEESMLKDCSNATQICWHKKGDVILKFVRSEHPDVIKICSFRGDITLVQAAKEKV